MAILEPRAVMHSENANSDEKWTLKLLLRYAECAHTRVPGLRTIPLRAIAIILFIASLNAIVWTAAAIVLVSQPSNCILKFDTD